MTRRAYILAFLTAVTAIAQTSFSGVVVADQNSRPLSGSLVTVTRELVRQDDQRPSRFSAITSAAGTFVFSGLPEGNYVVCSARPVTEDWVDFCAWTLTPPRVTLRIGAPVTGFQIRLEQGVRIDLQLEDPDDVIAKEGNERKIERVKVTVSATQVPPNPMQLKAIWRNRMEYSLVVPRRTGLRVVASADGADVGKAGEAAALAKRVATEDLALTPGLARKAVEMRLHRKK